MIPQIALQTRVIILMHTCEEVLPSNTGRLAAKSLTNSEIRINGRMGDRLSTRGLTEEGRQSLFLYPSAHAFELNARFVAGLKGPVTLIVPDGKWRQTRKLTRRESALAGIPHVKVSAGPPSQYRLRTQPNEESLCTLEAIARALGLLENPTVRAELEAILHVMVERRLSAKGRPSADQRVSAAIPGQCPNLKSASGGVTVARSLPAE